MIYTDYLESPIGTLEIQASDQGITSLVFCDPSEQTSDPRKTTPNKITPCKTLDDCKEQLTEYFSGKRKIFELPLAPEGTEFQQRVWSALPKISFGHIRTYSEIASEIGSPKSNRAVGSANGRNPISIIVPCHRVIGSNGTLTGYAWGIERKAWLLKHEGIVI